MTEKIEIKIDHEKIIGVLHGDAQKVDACIISCHGLLASKDSPKYMLLAESLSECGYSTLRFDFRGCGESEGNLENSHISNRLKDLDAVINYATIELGFNRFGLFGSSMGGYVSFLKASLEPKVKALVSLVSPFSMAELFDTKGSSQKSFEIDGILFGGNFLNDMKAHGTLTKEALESIKCPTLIFHGDFDLLVPVKHAHRLFESLTTKKMIKIIRGGDHIFSHPVHLNEIIKLSSEWFMKYLPK